MLWGLRRRLPPPRSDPRGQIRRWTLQEIVPGVTKLMEKKTKGLEAPCFPLVAVGVPDASGRTNPVAFMSNVLCCVCLQTECTPFIHLFREYRPEYERLRKTLDSSLQAQLHRVWLPGAAENVLESHLTGGCFPRLVRSSV
ncbi:uncharacterized protein LOC135415218 isoform X5 [Pseudopipra pipra]|uniref:uncharacterized protein LOC135415218 isoform X5 n=1 Tax=Pseudopipra pipra TaxID=415032 RepID=UPI003138B463